MKPGSGACRWLPAALAVVLARRRPAQGVQRPAEIDERRPGRLTAMELRYVPPAAFLVIWLYPVNEPYVGGDDDDIMSLYVSMSI